MQTLLFLGFLYFIFLGLKWLFQGGEQPSTPTQSSPPSTQNSCIFDEDPEILRPDESDFDPTDFM
ncbi:MAG: hypothetical protein ISR95_03445 [Candidatus Marinimicrobia bacterium]|nr:hypothetical protein [Candidatus Brocadiales bacterium]MBL7046669.1 hypothetical protein [Candidatus Neomarinimicrobiota bacterium]